MRHYKRKGWLSTLLLLILVLGMLNFSTSLEGQVKRLNDFYGDTYGVGNEICSEVSGTSYDSEVTALISLVLSKIGLRNRYEVIACESIDNCAALLGKDGQGYILYNPRFLSRVKGLNFSTATITAGSQDWIAVAIMAHELGHHLNMHLINQRSELTLREMELEADETAGRLLYLLGASLTDAQKVMYSSAVSVEGSSSHPPRAQRLAAIAKGWESAKKDAPTPPPVPNPRKEDGDKNKMVFVKGGTFRIGKSDEYRGKSARVSDFYLSRYEVTQKEWKEVMGNNPSYFQGCDDCPVESVSWDDVQTFLWKLNQKTGIRYRLPTNAEWDYAARGGVLPDNGLYAGGNILSEVGWYAENSGGTTHPVGQKKANSLGLYDMSGNVNEWLADSGRTKRMTLRPYRGGSWAHGELPGSFRVWYSKINIHDETMGFRLARTP